MVRKSCRKGVKLWTGPVDALWKTLGRPRASGWVRRRCSVARALSTGNAHGAVEAFPPAPVIFRPVMSRFRNPMGWPNAFSKACIPCLYWRTSPFVLVLQIPEDKVGKCSGLGFRQHAGRVVHPRFKNCMIRRSSEKKLDPIVVANSIPYPADVAV